MRLAGLSPWARMGLPTSLERKLTQKIKVEKKKPEVNRSHVDEICQFIPSSEIRSLFTINKPRRYKVEQPAARRYGGVNCPDNARMAQRLEHPEFTTRSVERPRCSLGNVSHVIDCAFRKKPLNGCLYGSLHQVHN